jgi:hypothetical protein
MLVRIAQSTFFRSCDRCPECRQEDDIVGVLLDNVLETLLYERHCETVGCDGTLKVQVRVSR